MQAGHVWYLDSGCSKHMTGHKELLANYKEKQGGFVKFGNDHLAPIKGQCEIIHENFTISEVSYVQGLSHNLLSIGKFCDKDLEVNFRKERCCVRTFNGKEVLTGTRKSTSIRLIFLKFNHQSPCV